MNTEELMKMQPFWLHLTDTQKSLVLENTIQLHFDSGTPILTGHCNCLGLIFVLSGVLRVYLLAEDGRQITISRPHAADNCVLSASCALSAITFDVQIEAEEDCTLFVLPSWLLTELMRVNVHMEAYLYRLTTEQFSLIMNSMERMFFMTLEQRIAAFLIDESAERGTPSIPFTQEKLATAIGSAREAVSRVLKIFVKEGCVMLSRGCIQILDKNALYQKLSM
ncbi:MAG: Crp/Fnr family transcriptional regulator [Lachnospiraceae bacterium]|nr:Crp/Fnr family transcriptional regulator [Lachnospiraceae bacterium]